MKLGALVLSLTLLATPLAAQVTDRGISSEEDAALIGNRDIWQVRGAGNNRSAAHAAGIMGNPGFPRRSL